MIVSASIAAMLAGTAPAQAVCIKSGEVTGVSRAWYRDMPLQQMLVDQGWVVFTLDNRGTNRRGTKFENAIYHAMGAAEVEDQLAGIG